MLNIHQCFLQVLIIKTAAPILLYKITVRYLIIPYKTITNVFVCIDSRAAGRN